MPGLVITLPPTAKLPCSWMSSGWDLLVSSATALAEAVMPAESRRSAVDHFRCVGLTRILLSKCGIGSCRGGGAPKRDGARFGSAFSDPPVAADVPDTGRLAP